LRLRTPLAEDAGFTLIELLVVLSLFGTLLGIAIPSYVGYEAYANQGSAQQALRQAVPAAESYYTENITYSGLSKAALDQIDSTLPSGVDVQYATITDYCLSASVGGQNWSVKGPGTGWHSNLSCNGTAISVNG